VIPLPAGDPEECDPRCRRCHRLLTDAESVRCGIGPVCREHLGITGRRLVRVRQSRAWDVDGQLDLLNQGI